MKEITGNHADDEIYAMLKKCSMDNEAIHKLLFQDPFHEVKRKRDRKKEVKFSLPFLSVCNCGNQLKVQNSINKDPTSRRTPNIYGRGNRVDRTDHSPRHITHDTGGGRPALVKEEAKPKLADNTNSTTQERKIKADALIGSSVDVSSNDSTETTSGDALASDIMGTEVKSPVSRKIDQAWKSQQLHEADTIDKNSENAFGSSNVQSKPVSTSSNDSASSAVCVSASDPVLVPSDDALHQAVVGAIIREAGSQRSVDLTETKKCTASEVAHSLMQEPANPQGIHKSQANESQSSSSSLILSGSTGCRPSSNYSNRSQQADGSPKALPENAMEAALPLLNGR
uniref:GBF-interacting protein 1 N-terminal domain-containing protein n=1 Tax=Kalanchoe fedtschenkoi TaxID=63787 RepID=A0A7N0TU39_KALFE